MKKLVIMSLLVCPSLAFAGGGYQASATVCESADKSVSLSWDFTYEDTYKVPTTEELIIQFKGETEGDAYQVKSSHSIPGGAALVLHGGQGSGNDNKFPMGLNLVVNLDSHWKKLEIVTEDGVKIPMTCQIFFNE